MAKNLKDFLQNCKTDVKKLNKIKGRKCKIVSNTSGSGLKIGEFVEVINILTTDNTYSAFGGRVTQFKRLSNGTILNTWCYINELEVIDCIDNKESIQEGIKELENSIKDIQSEIQTLKDKLEYMEVNKLNEYDEDQFKVYNTLKLLERKELSTLEKSKLIAELIKQ